MISLLPVPKVVIVREVSAAYTQCIRSGNDPIDVERAREQHSAYVRALGSLGITTQALPPLDHLADSVFVEDAAVILDQRAVISRPGAESRRDEAAHVSGALAAHCAELDVMQAPATLDGGDVLRAGDTIFVGRSARTNEAGIQFLARAAEKDGLEVVEVPVERALHLKSAVTAIERGALVYYAPWIDPAPFEARGFRCVSVSEPAGANVLALGASILVSTAAPETAVLLESLGFQVIRVDVSEFHKGDGALTCLSLRL